MYNNKLKVLLFWKKNMTHLKFVAVKLYIENPVKSLGKVNFIFSTDFAFLVLLLFLQKL